MPSEPVQAAYLASETRCLSPSKTLVVGPRARAAQAHSQAWIARSRLTVTDEPTRT